MQLLEIKEQAMMKQASEVPNSLINVNPLLSILLYINAKHWPYNSTLNATD